MEIQYRILITRLANFMLISTFAHTKKSLAKVFPDTFRSGLYRIQRRVYLYFSSPKNGPN